ncbi:hypothetical protein I0617_002522 [Staphylococcus pseudintermedius]|nr:hypothetical protein [Staphylococcus pseudintermedius]
MNNKFKAFREVITLLKNQDTSKLINKIANEMERKYRVPSGITHSFLNRELDDNFFDTTDIRLISLFILESFKVLGYEDGIQEYLTAGEINEAKQFDFHAFLEQDKITFPYDFQPVVKVNNVYSTKISVKQIAEFVDSKVINYNFDIQRESKLEKRIGKIIRKPTLNQKNIREMEKLLLEDGLKESTLFFNAAPMTSVNGDELIYDPESYTLTITEGTRLDVIDGFHRVLAAQNAYRENPTINFEFNVVFSNFTTAEAIKWQAQHSKATPWSKNRVAELQQESGGAKVVKAIKDKDAVFEHVIKTTNSTAGGGSIAFSELSKYIDELFKVETRRDQVNTVQEVSEVILAYIDLREINNTFNTRIYIYAFLKYYVESGLTIKEFIDEAHKAVDYLKNNEVNFRIEMANQSIKKVQSEAIKNIKILFEKARVK